MRERPAWHGPSRAGRGNLPHGADLRKISTVRHAPTPLSTAPAVLVMRRSRVPVLGDDGQVGLARHHAPRSSGASDGRTTELLRARAVADPAPVKSLPAVPRKPTHGDEPVPVTGIAVLGGAGKKMARASSTRLTPAVQPRTRRDPRRARLYRVFSSVGAAGRDDPFGGLAGEGGDHVEVAVVVEDRPPVQFCRGGDQ